MPCKRLQYITILFHCAIQVSCRINLQYNYFFELEYEWSYFNFTWPSIQQYTQALNNGDYIPENIAPTGLKIHNGVLYISLPKFRKGVPVTLTYLRMNSFKERNALLTPFPSWEMNDARNCSNLQSVQSMEIDTSGIMWVLDGERLYNSVNCPTKLLFLDLNNHGSLLYSYVFPNELILQNGGFLNDIVIDDSDGGFAYMTDNSNIDPGLIVYSKKKNRAWKIRHQSMFPEPWAVDFVVEGTLITSLSPIDGIALSPRPHNPRQNRTLFYTSITGLSLFAISTTVLKDEQLCRTDRWRRSVQFVGEKEGQTDGMMVDSRGTLYYTLLPLYGVGSWDIRDDFSSSAIVETDRENFVWPDGFAMDQKGYLYLICTSIFNYINQEPVLSLTPDIKFRIARLYTGTRSYLYNDL